jgi:serine/threonine-protein kinase
MQIAEQLNAALAQHYRILREIGRGGMAIVYLAHDVRHDRSVALKVFNSELGAALRASCFLEEIRLTAQLQHPNLLPLFDSGEVNGLLYYVMPYVEGESLRARLTRERHLPIDEAVHIAGCVASALEYAHAHAPRHSVP